MKNIIRANDGLFCIECGDYTGIQDALCTSCLKIMDEKMASIADSLRQILIKREADFTTPLGKKVKSSIEASIMALEAHTGKNN